MDKRSALRGLPLAATAAAGVLFGHWLVYGLALPDPRARTMALAASGHGYWLVAAKTAMVLCATSFGLVFLRHLEARLRGDSPARDCFVLVAARLAMLQVIAFTAMEIVERVVANAPVAGLFENDLFFLGVAVQLLVACACAQVAVWFGRASATICAALVAEGVRRAPAARIRLQPSIVTRDAAGRPFIPRAPPRA